MANLVPELKLLSSASRPRSRICLRRMRNAACSGWYRRFIGVFARPEHPLVLFLDDLQWLDSATLDVLEDLLLQPDLKHLLLIGAYRDNEVDHHHPLTRKLDAIRRTRRGAGNHAGPAGAST